LVDAQMSVVLACALFCADVRAGFRLG